MGLPHNRYSTIGIHAVITDERRQFPLNKRRHLTAACNIIPACNVLHQNCSVRAVHLQNTKQCVKMCNKLQQHLTPCACKTHFLEIIKTACQYSLQLTKEKNKNTKVIFSALSQKLKAWHIKKNDEVISNNKVCYHAILSHLQSKISGACMQQLLVKYTT